MTDISRVTARHAACENFLLSAGGNFEDAVSNREMFGCALGVCLGNKRTFGRDREVVPFHCAGVVGRTKDTQGAESVF